MNHTGTVSVGFHNIGTIDDHLLRYAVICSFHGDKLVCVRHHKRSTWEIPGGRRELGESMDETARRELFEETGAEYFDIQSVCEYHVLMNEQYSFGRIYTSNIQVFGELPVSEIVEVKLFEKLPDFLTYPDIQPKLLEKALSLKASETKSFY
ncbi:MAG: hypothetical protein CVT92_11705 [Bacteroidetes bacterium HGW-Bacteroidetes-1]|jgi:8-oxo-dGTP diphosphatase|nr:MAG: hypothetical protein CVT92_11705 [Bacteroidetes bacterium HGW-Bacteroidetes-1]